MRRRFVDRLRSDFPQHTFVDAWDRDTLRRLLRDADVGFTPIVERDAFASATRLRWVQSPAVGVGSLMFPELLASPVVITSARGIRARSIAEHVVGVTIALARRLPVAVHAQAAHRWAQEELETSARPVGGMRMTIVGLGSIGMEIAKIAIPLGIRVAGIRRRAESAPSGTEVTGDLRPRVFIPDRLPELLIESDIVVLAVPHTPETKQIIGRAEIDRMPRGAFLINIARGK